MYLQKSTFYFLKIAIALSIVTANYITPLVAQPEKPFLRFRDITRNVGLPGEFARCMMQDSKGFIWFGTDVDFKFYDGYSYVKYPLDLDDVIVSAILEDDNGDIWVFASADALYKLDRRKNTVVRYQVFKESINTLEQVYPKLGYSKCLLEDENHILWLSTYQGIARFDPSIDSFELVKPADSNYTGWIYLENDKVIWELTRDGLATLNKENPEYKSIKDPEGLHYQLPFAPIGIFTTKESIWLSMDHLWVYRIDKNSMIMSPLPKPQTIDNQPVTSKGIAVDQSKNVWITADDYGLFLYTHELNQLYDYRQDFKVDGSISNKPIDILIDNNLGVWISCYHSGISYHANSNKKFRAYRSFNGADRTLKAQQVISFFEKDDGNIWITTDGGGLHLWDRKSDHFIPFDYDPENRVILNQKTSMVVEDNFGRVWVQAPGTVVRFDSKRKDLQYITLPESGIQSNGRLFLDQDKTVWINRKPGGYHFDEQTQQFELKIAGYHLLYIDRDGTYWVKNPNLSQFCSYDLQDNSVIECIDANVVEVSEASNNVLWLLVGPQGDTLLGYNYQLNRVIDTLILVDSRDHLHNKLIVDNNDDIWIGTKNGLYRYDRETKKLDHYDHTDGVSSNFLRFEKPTKTRKGELIFGSSHGFKIFHPDSIRKNSFKPPIFITSFRIGGEDVPVSDSKMDTMDWKSPLYSHIHYAKEIKLAHFQNDLTFEFAALDYTNPERNQYKYQLIGYDNTWRSTSSAKRIAIYTNLSPRKYIFQVMGSNNDGVWSEKGDQLEITIMAPWYWAWWSKILYASLILIIAYSLYDFQLKKKLAHSEAVRLKEIDHIKSKLYTNITHEFRTPLTVISGMIDEMQNNPKEWFSEGVKLIKKNSQQLLTLINQLLDLSKLESGKLPVKMIQGNIVPYVEHLIQSFQSFADSITIRLHFLPDNIDIQMDYDPEKIQVIISNLIGNALKYTEANGDIYLKIQETNKSWCQLSVTDTGVGIAPDKLEYIFDRFYQADDSSTRKTGGTGIGLALTKELVKLLGGQIEVKSELNKGTEFKVFLPITHNAIVTQDLFIVQPVDIQTSLANSLRSLPKPAVDDGEQPSILIVEDNLDVQRYLQACLKDSYQLDFAENGVTGIEKAIESVPDIIISDVMMPEKNGYELVETLKTDVRTSHIPIILLTAKADHDSKIEGLESGADVYLEKPFHKTELDVRLRKLIELRRRLQLRYATLGASENTIPDGSQREGQFVDRIKSLVLENVSDEKYGINELCFRLRISRTQLHRKLKAITGLSTSHVIRSIRLIHAKELLLKSDLNVSEVGYAVGFSNRSHFTQVFTKEFGKPPSSFKQIM
ncbi:MAG: response regulator [Saprospiraceae bacterium]|nr:response regulator [Saprospiraceae bacterium]